MVSANKRFWRADSRRELSAPGAGAATARCVAACVDSTQAQGTPAWWREPRKLWNKRPCDNGTACAVRAHWEDLDMLLLATGSPIWPTPSSPHFSALWHAPCGLCKPCCFQCVLDAVVTLHRPGVRGADVGLQHLHSIPAPLFRNLHCKPVVLLPKGTCCCPLKRSAMVALPWTWGCMPPVLRFINSASPL